jgi:hypothetical protein
MLTLARIIVKILRQFNDSFLCVTSICKNSHYITFVRSYLKISHRHVRNYRHTKYISYRIYKYVYNLSPYKISHA